MIEVENELLTIISDKLQEVFPNLIVLGITNLNPSEFPCVYIEEADNYVLRNTSDSANNENHSVLVYEVNIFSNRAVNKKGECKKILAAVDKIMNNLEFTRTSKQPYSFDDTTKYRIFARYTAIISSDKQIYRR